MRVPGRDSPFPAPGRREGGAPQADGASGGRHLLPAGPLGCRGRGSVEPGRRPRPRRSGGGEGPKSG